MSLADTDRDGSRSASILGTTPHLTDFPLKFTVSSHDRGKGKKGKTVSVIYRLISGLFYCLSESDWKENKGTFVVPLH